MWKHSLDSLEHHKRHNTRSPVLVSSLDPDCRSRREEEGRSLEDVDEQDDEALMKEIWGCIRTGRQGDIQDICEKYAQPWRAASLLGGTVYGAGEGQLDEPGGNACRNLWMDLCWTISENQAGRGDVDYERAVYAALAGNQRVLEGSSLCKPWQEQCWLRFYLAVERFKDGAIDQHLQKQQKRSKWHAGRADGITKNKAQEETAETQSAEQVTCESILHDVEHCDIDSVKAEANDLHHR
jgi:hypothetical protein